MADNVFHLRRSQDTPEPLFRPALLVPPPANREWAAAHLPWLRTVSVLMGDTPEQLRERLSRHPEAVDDLLSGLPNIQEVFEAWSCALSETITRIEAVFPDRHAISSRR